MANKSSSPDCLTFTLTKLCGILVGIAVAVGIVVGVLFAVQRGSDVLQGLSPDFQKVDPFKGANASALHTWRTSTPGVGGLDLDLVNALDSNWDTEFTNAVSDWENGSPDALTLSTSQAASPDSACDHITGKLKVCNGDYGDTQWTGINEVLIDEYGKIVSSAARMNEFYLSKADSTQRQYTMCHEIGHGFGLPHTDENFYNRDTGNCLDYTTRPSANLHPGQVNYNLLAELYGTVGSTSKSNSTSTTTSTTTSNNINNNSPSHRSIRATHQARRQAAFSKAARAVRQFHQDLMKNGPAQVSGKWRMLYSHVHGQGYELVLEDGYTAQIHTLSPLQEQ